MILLAALFGALLHAASPDQVDRIFAPYTAKGSPGCAVGVVQDGKPVIEKGYGFANLEHDILITPQIAFYLGSTSKQFTAMAVMQLIERGAMKLDDPIRKWNPRLPEYMQPVTIRHLLEHTSGIRDYFALWMLSGPANDAALTEDQVLEILARQKRLNFTPGTEFLYSNSGYFLLATLLRPAAYSMLPALAEKTIFTPLGMTHTLYYVDRFALLPKRATGYSPGDAGNSPLQAPYRINTATLDIAGDGGVFTTLEDTIRWLQFFDKPEGPQAKAFQMMQERARLTSGDYAEYGRGLMLKRYRGLDTISHVGGLRGYHSEILWIPSRRLGVTCLCNTSQASVGALARQVADLFLGDLPKPVFETVTPADLARKAGIFRDRDAGDILAMAPAGPGLAAQYQGFQMLLMPETPLRFRSVNSPLDFEIEFRAADANSKTDEPRFIRVESESHKPANFERIEYRPQPIANPAQYEGQYDSTEAHTRLSIRFWESRLTLEQGSQTLGVMEYAGTDRVQASAINIEFLRDAEKHITGFRLNTGRLRGLEFTRVSSTP